MGGVKAHAAGAQPQAKSLVFPSFSLDRCQCQVWHREGIRRMVPPRPHGERRQSAKPASHQPCLPTCDGGRGGRVKNKTRDREERMEKCFEIVLMRERA